MATLIRNGIVLPMADASRRVLDPGSVLVDGDSIVAVGTVEALDVDPRVQGADVVDATDHAVTPGLHNCHLHSGLLRGTAEAMSLWDWLKAYVDPAHKALTPEIARAASMQCYAESLLAGTTSVMDMWRFMEGSAEVALELGIRATLVPYVADEEGFDYFESISSNRRLLEQYASAGDGRVRTWVGLEHLMYCTPECFAQAVDLMQEFDTGLHTHSSETIWEVEESLRRWGRRPVEVFYDRGILGPRTVVAHCVWLSDREIEVLAQTGTSVAHCPASNMKLASGPARIGDLRRAGVHVGLGSDGEKENNNLDLVEEMKFASLLQKVTTLDPTTGDPWDVLAMATTEIDISKIEVGQSITVLWRGHPVFIRRRTSEEIKAAEDVNLADLKDPQPDSDRVQKGKEQWLILVGVCTHLGCIPLGQKQGDPRGEFGGWFCPCHGSQYDTSGRIRKGPAPKNLEVPDYLFASDTLVKIG